MKLILRVFHPFWICALSLFYHPSAFSIESENTYLCSTEDSENEPTLFVPDQLAALTNDANQLIGGLISPLSGNPCLNQTDFTVIGAQNISLDRVYIAPHMPYTFQKSWDADCYYRRKYLSRHYDGWTFFPHTRLWLDRRKKTVHLIQPSGAAYDFSIAKSKTTLLHPYAISNVGTNEIPRGQFDPRNTRIAYENAKITVFSPDGSIRHYFPRRESLFLLEKETLPNGKILKYHYTVEGNLFLIESRDPQERYVYASINIGGSPKEEYCHLTSSNGLSSAYEFEKRPYKGKFRQGTIKREYYGATPPLLTSASSPEYREEIAEYIDPSCLLHSFSGKDKIFTANYKPFGKRENKHFRIDQLLFPVGKSDAFIPVYQMSYQPAIAGEKEGETTVKNADGSTIRYHFSKNLLTTSIQYFDGDGTLKKEKIFFWNDNGWLSFVETRDGSNHLFFRKSYTYDELGNPITETITGDLRGTGSEENYCIRREFSQDGRNLLLKEETEGGKITTFEYLPNTNLITLKCIKERDRILVRESYHYDDCHNLIRKSIDDTGAQKRITHYLLRQQEPFLHMPEWIEEKHLDRGVEKFLKRTHLTYDPYGNVAEEKIYDANGEYAYSIFKAYNERGNLLSETNRLGQKQLFTYDEKGHCLEETNFSQRLKEQMNYDTQGRLRDYRAIGEDGTLHTAAYTYDINDHLIQKIDTYNNIYSYTYDPISHKVERTDSPPIQTTDGGMVSVSTTSTYDALGREISKTDANGYTTHYRHNAYGSPVEITYPDGSKEHYRYTKKGEIASHTDRDGLMITYLYDVLGRLISKHYGNNLGQENYVYDSFHLLEEVDLEGHTTHYFYDGAGRKVREEIDDRVTEYTYDSLGRLSIISQKDLLTHFKRDLEDRVLEESKTDNTGKLLHKISYAYNEDGELSHIKRYIDGKEAVESYQYDSLGREIEHQDPFGYQTTIHYNEETTLQILSIDPNGVVKKETKDPYLRNVKEETFNPRGNILASSEKYYGPNGNMIHWKEHVYKEGHYQNTQHTYFTYTSDNKLANCTRAFGTSNARTTHYTYTPGGKVASKTLPDNTTLFYGYDHFGHLCSLNSSDGKIKHRFESNRKGKLLYAVDEVENISIRREVDPFGNVVREYFPNHIEVKKTYNHLDRLTTLQIPNIGSISYTYDPLFLRSVNRFSADGRLQYTHHYEQYDLDGNIISENMIYNSGKVKHELDQKGRDIEISSPYFSQKCCYDACDKLIQNTIDQTSISYTYDDLSQLTSEHENRYACDSLFNRREKNGNYFQYNDLNEIVDQAYDLNGNPIQKGNAHYLYDPLNRLIEAAVDTKTIRFYYDPLGRRLAKTVIDSQEYYTENYLYHGQQEIGAMTPEGTLKNLKVLGAETHPAQPRTVAVELNNETFAPLIDAQGNICRLIDPFSREIEREYTFTAFGEEEITDINPWRYRAKRFDPELNLIYFGKRYYDPEQGRWLTTDPAGFVDNVNPYQYAFNNPYCYYDPDGEFIFLACIPFAVLITPAALKICADAIIVGIGCWGLYKSTQYVADVAGSPYMLSEDKCHVLMSTAHDKKYDQRGWEVKHGPSSSKGQKNPNKENEKKSPGNLQKQVEQGKAPKTIERVDKGRGTYEEDHVHFKDGSALNSDGKWKHGGRQLTRQESDWLQNNGWYPPEKS